MEVNQHLSQAFQGCAEAGTLTGQEDVEDSLRQQLEESSLRLAVIAPNSLCFVDRCNGRSGTQLAQCNHLKRHALRWSLLVVDVADPESKLFLGNDESGAGCHPGIVGISQNRGAGLGPFQGIRVMTYETCRL